MTKHSRMINIWTELYHQSIIYCTDLIQFIFLLNCLHLKPTPKYNAKNVMTYGGVFSDWDDVYNLF